MKNVLLGLAMSATFISCAANATGIDLNPLHHATKTELAAEGKARAEADKTLNSKIDQTRADGAAAIGKTNQAVKSVDDKLNNAIGAQVGVNAAQHANNVQQQNQINAVQGAAQTANDRATNLEGRADKAEGAIRETNAQVAVTDARSINNSVRLDGAEANIGKNTAAIGQLDTRMATQEDITAALSQSFNGYTASTNRRLDKMQSQIDSTDRKAEKAQNMAAAAFAAAALQFNTDLEAGFQVAGGASTLGGKQAMAIGMGGAVTKNLAVFGTVVSASSATGGAVSATYSFGR